MSTTHLKRPCQTLIIMIILVALLFPASTVRADVAPPTNPPGSNLEPGSESTQVRMLAETVTIDVQADYAPESLGKARITASFTMRNLGTETESMAARFPISAHDGYSSLVEIKNLQIKVNGKSVSHRRITGEDPHRIQNEVPWAEFDVVFPPAEDVNIQVAYTVNGTGYFPFVSYDYILSSGAGWKDTIGSGDIILRLPYEANELNYILENPGIMPQFSGNEVRWHFDNLEPSFEDNMVFSLIAPAIWKKILTERVNVSQDPNDGEAWGRLGKAYKEITFAKGMRTDKGGPEVYDLGVKAYERCLDLLPKDSLWHAGFAELLYQYYFWEKHWNNSQDPSLFRVMEELNHALELDPKNELALEIAQNLQWDIPEGVTKDGDQFIFLYLTATPPALPTQLETAEAVPTMTSIPGFVPTNPAPTVLAPLPAPTQADKPAVNLPLCNSAALALLLAGFLLLFRR